MHPGFLTKTGKHLSHGIKWVGGRVVCTCAINLEPVLIFPVIRRAAEKENYHVHCSGKTSDAWPSGQTSVISYCWSVHSLPGVCIFLCLLWLNEERRHMQISTEIMIPWKNLRRWGRLVFFRVQSDLEYKEFLGLSSMQVCHFPVFLNYETMTIWGEK